MDDLNALIEALSLNQMNEYLIQRQALISELVSKQDQSGLLELQRADKINLAYLQSELARLGQSIHNTSKVQDYISCAR